MTKLSMCMSSSSCELKFCSCEVVIGRTRGVRLLTILRCVVATFGRVWCIWKTVRKGLMHLGTTCHVAVLVVCPPGVGRQTLHPSSPPATSALAATSSEEEGLHACPLPHNFSEYICDVAVLRRRKDCTQVLLPTMRVCTSEEEGQAFFLTMSVSKCSPCFVLSSACQLRGESLRCECACVGEQRKLVRWLPRRTWKRTLQVQVGVKQSRSGPGFILDGDDF